MSDEKRVAGFLIGGSIYGGVVLLVFAATAFVLGTGDFSEWGQGGRFGAVFVSVLACWLSMIPFEAFDLRKNFTAALLELWGKP